MMRLFFVVTNYCCMCISGRAVPHYAVVFLVLDQGLDCLFILGSEGADRSGAASSSLSAWRCRGCSATGLGLQQPLQLLVPLGFRACVSHYLSFSFLWEKICKSQRMRRWKRAVHIIIVLILQSVPQYKARCDLFRPFGWAHPSCLSFSYTHLCRAEPLHICCEATHGVLVHPAALKLVCFRGKDTRPESKWSGIQSWLCDGLAMWPWANTFSLDLSFFSCKVRWLLGDCWNFFCSDSVISQQAIIRTATVNWTYTTSWTLVQLIYMD